MKAKDTELPLSESDDERKKQDKSLMKLTTNTKMIATCTKAHFLQLNKDTDLNKMCDDWFWTSSVLNLFNKWTHKKRGDLFSSFKMADKYLDQALIGEIDVVSDAEIIKQLLKMPFNKSGHLSLMVHRVGKTLLIDEFDIHKYLLKMEENEWNWLKKFYYDIVLEALTVKQLTRMNKSREALNDRDLLLKFLCCSVGKDKKDEFRQLINNENNARPSPTSSEFLSNVFWTFDNMKMLIGTNLPIFGDETRPAITLRLRDMRKPISILTGLDYWLDNLICNIPELHMCYHIDGIVQKYEIMRTEDIPYLNGSAFPPNAIKTIAKNILSFLKSNVTKEGHTYWLFKGPDDEIVKLYDLTSLCDGYINDKYDNSYTVPVAMLLYRVANNIINNNTKETIKDELDTVSTLLYQCLQMLNKEQHSEVYSHACYLLSDLYIKDELIEENIDDNNNNNNNHNDTPTTPTPTTVPATTATTTNNSTTAKSIDEKNLTLPIFNLNNLIKKDLIQSKLNYNEKDINKIQSNNQNAQYAHSNSTNKTDDDEDENEDIDIKSTEFKTSIIEQAKLSIKYLTQALYAIEINEQQTTEKQKHQNSTNNNNNNSDDNSSSSNQTNTKNETEKSEYIVNRDNFIKPEKIIPLKFHPNTAQSQQPQSEQQQQLLPINRNLKKFINLNKSLILQKLLISYYCLAKNLLKTKLYGVVFKYAKLALSCYFSRKQLWPYDELNSIHLNKILFKIISLCGDCRLLMINELKYKNKADINDTIQNVYLAQFNHLNSNEKYLIKTFESIDLDDDDCATISEDKILHKFRKLKFIYELNLDNFLLNYFYTLDTYNLVLKYFNKLNKYDLDGVRKRYGNVKNELGTYYLNECSNLIKYDTETMNLVKLIENLLDKSFNCFNDGLTCFEYIHDYANCALLTANCAKLWRIYSRFFTENFQNKIKENLEAPQQNDLTITSPTTQSTTTTSSIFNLTLSNYLSLNKIDLLTNEKVCLLKAIEYYLKAIKYFDHKLLNIQNQYLLNSINWDLSSTYFCLGCLIQDNNFTNDNEKCIIEYMNCSIDNLKSIVIITQSAGGNTGLNKIDLDYRLGVIHHRLASLYHHLYRQQENESKKKHLKSLGELHYDKALVCFSQTHDENVCDQLRVLLEHVALLEFHFELSTSNSVKIKDLENIIKLLLKCRNCFRLFLKCEKYLLNEDNDFTLNETYKLTNIFIQRLQFVLKNFIKFYSVKKKPTQQEINLSAKLKEFYKKSLNCFNLLNAHDQTGDGELKSLNRNGNSQLFKSFKGLIGFLNEINVEFD